MRVKLLIDFIVCFVGFNLTGYSETCKVVVQDVKGQVQVTSKENTMPLNQNDSVALGDSIQTLNQGMLDLLCNDRFALHFYPDSELKVQEITASHLSFELIRGTVIFKIVKSGEDQSFAVSGGDIFEVSGGYGVFYLKNSPQDVLSHGRIALREGKLQANLKESGMSLNLLENQALNIPAGFGIPELVATGDEDAVILNDSDALSTFNMKAQISGSLKVLQDLAAKSKAGSFPQSLTTEKSQAKKNS